MENKIDIAELLKDYPKGTKLYSPIFGDVYLEKIRPHLAVVVTTKGNAEEEFLYDGRYGVNGECVLFPSKENRDWSTFQRPFKDGDVVATNDGIWIGITTGGANQEWIPTYCVIGGDGEFDAYLYAKGVWMFDRLATEEEKQKLFQVIKDNGYRWNDETRTLEKLELVPDKFDINTLKPFDKVLVRDNNTQKWTADLFSLFDKSLIYSYSCVGHCTHQCIPYEGNEHLLGTSNDCDDFYKTW